MHGAAGGPGRTTLAIGLAAEHAHRGSPTVLVDGVDPFGDDAGAVGLSCRLYRTDAGLVGAPTVDQLVSALR